MSDCLVGVHSISPEDEIVILSGKPVPLSEYEIVPE